MKRLILLVILSLTFATSYSQKKSVDLVDKYGITNTMTIENGDTSYAVFFIFQNAKYQHISDLKVLSFYHQEDLDEFVVAVKKIKEIPVAKSENIEMKGNKWELVKTSSYISLRADGGFTFLQEKYIDRWLKVWESCSFSSR